MLRWSIIDRKKSWKITVFLSLELCKTFSPELCRLQMERERVDPHRDRFETEDEEADAVADNDEQDLERSGAEGNDHPSRFTGSCNCGTHEYVKKN
jgi:hypothetical protein